MIIAECIVCGTTYSQGAEFENLCKANEVESGDQQVPEFEELSAKLQDKKLICINCNQFEVIFTHNTKLK